MTALKNASAQLADHPAECVQHGRRRAGGDRAFRQRDQYRHRLCQFDIWMSTGRDWAAPPAQCPRISMQPVVRAPIARSTASTAMVASPVPPTATIAVHMTAAAQHCLTTIPASGTDLSQHPAIPAGYDTAHRGPLLQWLLDLDATTSTAPAMAPSRTTSTAAIPATARSRYNCGGYPTTSSSTSGNSTTVTTKTCACNGISGNKKTCVQDYRHAGHHHHHHRGALYPHLDGE